jgi:uncharacterized small protein (DUF1192 family)
LPSSFDTRCPERPNSKHPLRDEVRLDFSARHWDSLQDLDPLSVTELQERIAVLEQELARVRGKLSGAVDFRANADALFKQ